ncbi:MAG: tetratricopeptide repeat protein [Gammaproteobacteria bacterium]|nr:tetratricopeptide repeat protein [Gammaproteobacteria bacterium]
MQRYGFIFLTLGMVVGCTTHMPVPITNPGLNDKPATDIAIAVPELPLHSDQPNVILPGPQTSPAVMKLLEQAHSATLQGDLASAESFLERSIRIEPKNPLMWHYLAKIRLQQGRFNEAAGLAQKSNALARGDKTLQMDNWRIIAHACNRSGDLAGAQEAQRNIDALQR